MSTRKLLVLSAVFLGLLAFVVLFERHQPTSEESAKARKRLVDFKPESLAALALERPDLPRVDLRRGPEERWLVAGEPADAPTVDALVADLARLDLVGEARTEFDPKEFGLDAPRATALLTWKDGTTKKLLFGKELPGTDATAVAEGARFGAVKYAPIAALTKPYDDFRGKALFDVPVPEVTRLTIGKGAARVVVARAPSTPKGGAGEWRIEEPVTDLASRAFVDQLLSDLAAARISEFPSLGASDLPRIGLAPPSVTVTLQKGEQVVASLAFGAVKADATGKVYAQRGKTVVLIDDRVQEDLAKEFSAYREVKAFPVDSWTATRVSADVGGVVAGAEKVEGEWRSSGRTVGAAVVEDLVDRLSRVEAKLFVGKKDYSSRGIPVAGKKAPPPTPLASFEVTVEKETEPRLVRFFPASELDGSPVVAVEVSGRSDAMLADRSALDDLAALAEKVRAAASGAKGTPTPAPSPAPSPSGAPAPAKP